MNQVDQKISDLENSVSKLKKINTDQEWKHKREMDDLASKVSRLEQQNRDAESKLRNLESEMRRLK